MVILCPLNHHYNHHHCHCHHHRLGHHSNQPVISLRSDRHPLPVEAAVGVSSERATSSHTDHVDVIPDDDDDDDDDGDDNDGDDSVQPQPNCHS